MHSPMHIKKFPICYDESVTSLQCVLLLSCLFYIRLVQESLLQFTLSSLLR